MAYEKAANTDQWQVLEAAKAVGKIPPLGGVFERALEYSDFASPIEGYYEYFSYTYNNCL